MKKKEARAFFLFHQNVGEAPRSTHTLPFLDWMVVLLQTKQKMKRGLKRGEGAGTNTRRCHSASKKLTASRFAPP